MRVLLCRPRPESLATARELAARGYEALVAPVLATVPLPFALPDRPPDAVLATSARAVEALGPERARSLLPCPAFAVGRRTAEAFRTLGFARVGAADGDADALAALVAATMPRGAALLYLAGRIRTPALEGALAREGFAVTPRETYEARQADPWGAEVEAAFAAGDVGACLHYSARSAALAHAFAVQRGCAPAFAAATHLCLSEPVAAALRARGVDRLRVARAPTEASLVQALEASLPVAC